MEAYLLGIEASYGVKTQLAFREMYPPVVNDEALVDAFVKANGADRVLEIEPQMIAEDFSIYQKAVPGIFVFAGIYNEEKGFVHPLHSAKFDFDESALLVAVDGMLNMLRTRGVLL